MTLGWDPVNDPSVVGYALYYGFESGKYTDMAVSRTNSATATGLKHELTYYFAVTSYNSDGTQSPYSEEISFFIAPPVIVNKEGLGTVLVHERPTNDPASNAYIIVAQPGPGMVFSGWSGSFTSSAAQLNFMWRSNVVLHATFVPSPFPAVQGNYNGLFAADPPSVASCGAFSVSVAKSGTYSGRVQISTNRYAFTGRLDVQCRASNIIPRSGNSSLVLGLEVGTGENAGNISGSLTDGNWLANLSGERAAFDSVKSPAPLAGNYTIAFPGVDADSTLPAGDGFGTLRIFRGGLTVFAGSLADGTPVSYSTAVSTSSLWQVYAPLYGGKGALAGKPSLNNLANTADLGPVTWMKLANPSARFYHAGFTNQINALGSAYVAPSGSGRVLSLTNGSVQFTSGNLAGDFTDAVAIWPRGRLTGLSDTGLNLTISPGTGTLRGNVVDPASGQRLTVNGAVLQNLDAGFGFLLGTNLSSRVRIGP